MSRHFARLALGCLASIASGCPEDHHDAHFAIAAVDDDYAFLGAATLSIDAARGVLGNDSVTADTALTAGTFPTAEGGTVVLAADGSFTYTPAADFGGPDTFDYTLTSASADVATVTGTVHVHVGRVRDDVVVGFGDLVDGNVLDNDDVLDGATVTSADPDVALAADGAFTATGDFDYVATDASGSATGHVTVTLGHPEPDRYVSLGPTLTVPAVDGLLANDTGGAAIVAFTQPAPDDPDAVALTVAPDGGFSLEPAPTPGALTFTYTSRASGRSLTTDVTVDVGIVRDDAYQTTAGTAVALDVAANDVLPSPASHDAPASYTPAAGFLGRDVLTYTATAPHTQAVGHITVDVWGLRDDAFDHFGPAPTTGNVLANDVLPAGATVTPSAHVAADGTFTAVTADPFDYEVQVLGTTLTGHVTFRAGGAVADHYTAFTGSTLSEPLAVDAADGLLANDDALGATVPMTVVAATTETDEGGTVDLAADGSFVYTPPLVSSGTDRFDYVVQSAGLEDTAEVTLTLVVLHDDVYPTGEGDPVSGNVLDNDQLPAGATLVPAPPVQADGSFTATASFVYTVTLDGAEGSARVTLDLSVGAAVADRYDVLADGPVLVPAARGLLANDTLPGATAVPATTPTALGGTAVVEANGRFLYTRPTAPDSGPDTGPDTGTDTFAYQITDGVATRTATVTITLGRVRPDTYRAFPGATHTFPIAEGLHHNDGGALTYALVTTPDPYVTLAPDGALVATFPADYRGTHVVPATAALGATTAHTTLSFDVHPLADDLATLPGVVHDASTGDLTPEAWTGATATSPSPDIALAPDGTYTYTRPAGAEPGPTTFEVTVTIGGASQTVTVTAIIAGAVDDLGALFDGSFTSDFVLANDYLSPAAKITSATPNTTIGADGRTLTYTSSPIDATGPELVTYTVSDQGHTYSAVLTVDRGHLTNDHYDRLAVAFTIPAAEGVLANDVLPQSGATLSGVAHPFVTVAADGAVTSTYASQTASQTDATPYQVTPTFPIPGEPAGAAVLEVVAHAIVDDVFYSRVSPFDSGGPTNVLTNDFVLGQPAGVVLTIDPGANSNDQVSLAGTGIARPMGAFDGDVTIGYIVTLNGTTDRAVARFRGAPSDDTFVTYRTDLAWPAPGVFANDLLAPDHPAPVIVPTAGGLSATVAADGSFTVTAPSSGFFVYSVEGQLARVDIKRGTVSDLKFVWGGGSTTFDLNPAITPPPGAPQPAFTPASITGPGVVFGELTAAGQLTLTRDLGGVLTVPFTTAGPGGGSGTATIDIYQLVPPQRLCLGHARCVGGPGALTALDVVPPGSVLVAETLTTVKGATVTIGADGSYVYENPSDYRTGGSLANRDLVPYRYTGLPSRTVRMPVTIEHLAWHVQAGGTGDGRSAATPLGALDANVTADQPGDIFLAHGGGTGTVPVTAFRLDDDQQLVGKTFVYEGQELLGEARPFLDSGDGAILVGNNNRLQGFEITSRSTTVDARGSDGLVIDDVIHHGQLNVFDAVGGYVVTNNVFLHDTGLGGEFAPDGINIHGAGTSAPLDVTLRDSRFEGTRAVLTGPTTVLVEGNSFRGSTLTETDLLRIGCQGGGHVALRDNTFSDPSYQGPVSVAGVCDVDVADNDFSGISEAVTRAIFVHTAGEVRVERNTFDVVAQGPVAVLDVWTEAPTRVLLRDNAVTGLGRYLVLARDDLDLTMLDNSAFDLAISSSEITSSCLAVRGNVANQGTIVLVGDARVEGAGANAPAVLNAENSIPTFPILGAAASAALVPVGTCLVPAVW